MLALLASTVPQRLATRVPSPLKQHSQVRNRRRHAGPEAAVMTTRRSSTALALAVDAILRRPTRQEDRVPNALKTPALRRKPSGQCPRSSCPRLHRETRLAACGGALTARRWRRYHPIERHHSRFIFGGLK